MGQSGFRLTLGAGDGRFEPTPPRGSCPLCCYGAGDGGGYRSIGDGSGGLRGAGDGGSPFARYIHKI